MALVTVLMISMVMLLIILTGVQLTGRNLFTMARSHDRNVALYAAEAGIYQTLAEIEAMNRYPDNGPRPTVRLSNGATFQVSIQRTGDLITLRSQGVAARATRTLEVTVTLSADSYYAITTEKKVGLANDVFINGVQSTLNPKPDKGNVHTNSGDPSAILKEVTNPGDPQRLSVTGQATAVGGITATIEGKKKSSAQFVSPQAVDRNALLGSAPYTTITEIPADGVIRGNMKIDTDVDWEGNLTIPEGSVLHATKDFALAHGVSGGGTLVVDGEALIRASDQLDLRNGKGVFLYAGGGVSMVHPQAVQQTLTVQSFDPPPATPENPNPQPPPPESRETFVQVPDPMSNFFAGRPVDTEFNLRQGLPLDAPTDMEFFEYYETQALTPSESFKLWLDGDGSDEAPGLRPEVKAWLEKSKDPRVRDAIRNSRGNNP